MKKIVALLLAIVMLLSLVACTETTEPSSETTAPPASTDKPADYSYSIDLTGVTTLEELEARIEEHLAASIASLNTQWKELAAEIDTYEKYVENAERVSAF